MSVVEEIKKKIKTLFENQQEKEYAEIIVSTLLLLVLKS